MIRPSRPLSVLIVEDSEDDALLLVRALKKGGFEPTVQRVDAPDAMSAALENGEWDVVLSDHSMPHFSASEALTMVLDLSPEIPFILVSGAIGEEAAVAMMRRGAQDYLPKNDLARLVPAIERELSDAETRKIAAEVTCWMAAEIKVDWS